MLYSTISMSSFNRQLDELNQSPQVLQYIVFQNDVWFVFGDAEYTLVSEKIDKTSRIRIVAT